jgi:exo-beta-1,3-glucanase (GH17 family)
MAPNTTAYGVPSVPETTTSCTESKQASSVPTPVVITTKAPEPEQPAYTPVVPEVPKPEAPKPETPEVPTPEAPKPETPEVPKPEAPKPYPTGEKPAPKPEAPKPETPEVPKPEAPKPEAPKPEAPKPETPEVPKPEAPKPYPTGEKPAPKPEAPKPNPTGDKPKPKPTGSYSNGGSYSNSGHIVTNGDKWAMTYTPYAPDGNCKTESDIKTDIKQIADLGFTTIRSYSTDCGVFEYVVPECQKYGLKIVYGIFLEAGGKDGKGPFSQYANDQLEAIKKNAPKDGISMLIVGNECMFNNNCQPAELASYIDYCREQLHGAGFPKDIAVTTTEPVGVWEEKGAALCDHIDIFTVQVHPYFTASVSADMAGDFAAQQLEQAAKVCPEAAAKGKYITEIGWPTAGQSNGKAIAGVAEQKEAMKKIIEKVGSSACLFSFKDDPWKHAGDLGVEQHFGSYGALTS